MDLSKIMSTTENAQDPPKSPLMEPRQDTPAGPPITIEELAARNEHELRASQQASVRPGLDLSDPDVYSDPPELRPELLPGGQSDFIKDGPTVDPKDLLADANTKQPEFATPAQIAAQPNAEAAPGTTVTPTPNKPEPNADTLPVAAPTEPPKLPETLATLPDAATTEPPKETPASTIPAKRSREPSPEPPNKWTAFQQKMWEEKVKKDAKYNYAEAKEKERKDLEKKALERQFGIKQEKLMKEAELKEKMKGKGKGRKFEEDDD